jgi:hypothetical protein
MKKKTTMDKSLEYILAIGGGLFALWAFIMFVLYAKEQMELMKPYRQARGDNAPTARRFHKAVRTRHVKISNDD